MKQEFIKFLNVLMEANPELVEKYMTEELEAYIKTLTSEAPVKEKIMTEKGKMILQYMQDNMTTHTWKARDIADGLGITSRGVSGSMRKLAADNFVERIGENPIIYMLTDKGKTFDLSTITLTEED